MAIYILWDNNDETPVGGGKQEPFEQAKHSTRWLRTELAPKPPDWLAEHYKHTIIINNS